MDDLGRIYRRDREHVLGVLIMIYTALSQSPIFICHLYHHSNCHGHGAPPYYTAIGEHSL